MTQRNKETLGQLPANLGVPLWAQRAGLIVLFSVLAGLVNLWPVNLFFGLAFMFGATLSFLALALWGWLAGLTVGAVAVYVGFHQVFNPLFFIMSMSEVVFACIVYRAGRRDVIFCCGVYWLTIAPILYYGLYTIDFAPEFDVWDYLVVFLKLAVNGILNGLFASLFYTAFRLLMPRFTRDALYVPIHQAFYYVLVTLILVPSLLMTSIHSQARYERMQVSLQNEVLGRAELMAHFLEEWQLKRSPSISSQWLQDLLKRLVVREGWQATVVDNSGRVLVSTTEGFVPGPLDSGGHSDPKIVMTGSSTYIRDLARRDTSPFFRWQQARIGAVASVPSLDWKVYAEGPVRIYAKVLKQGLIENLVLMLILCLLGLIVSTFLARIIGRPIQILADLTSDLGNEKISPLPVLWPKSRIKETARLIKNFQAMQSELTARFRQLEQADRAKSAFLATISHEIRTPLGAILGFSEILLKDRSMGSLQTEHLQAIHRNGEQLLSVIGDVLDLSKIEAGKLSLEKFPVTLAHLFDDVLRSLRLQTEAKGLSFQLERSEDLPLSILTDPTRFRQILWNLTGNAIKFTAAGSITITLAADWDVASQKHILSVRIQDTGIGIAPEHRETIFRAFAQADSSMTRRFGGSGLGLVLSRKLAEALGGHLELSWSEIGKGSRFVFELPLAATEWNIHVPANHNPDLVRAPNPQLKNTTSQLSILLVDDAPDNLLLVKFLLESQGFQVFCANDAREGLECLARQNFDLILTDIQMPQMDGYEFVRKLRSSQVTVPVIAMTAHALSEERERCLAAGCDAYLSKPLNSGQLFETVKVLTRARD